MNDNDKAFLALYVLRLLTVLSASLLILFTYLAHEYSWRDAILELIFFGTLTAVLTYAIKKLD